MNKSLLLIFACVLVMVDGQEELRKEERESSQLQPRSTQPLDISKEINGNLTFEREKRMPEAKKSGDISYGYAWNIGNGVSYMKMQVGKTNNPIQHKYINSFQDSGRSYDQNQNDKTGYEKLHEDFLKMSQQISSQKNQNLFAKPKENPGIFGMGSQQFKDTNFPSFAINNDQNKELQGSHAHLQEFNNKLRQEYDKFNKDVQLSGWPHQGYSLKELNMAQSLKTLQSNGKGNEPYNVETKPINILEFSHGFLKGLENGQNFPLPGNLNDGYKSAELPMHIRNVGGNDKGMEVNFRVMNSEENAFRYKEDHGEETITQNINIEKQQNPSINDAVFDHIGETNYKSEGGEDRAIPKDGAWSTQNIVNNHQSNIQRTDNKQDLEETRKNIDVENVQKVISETLRPPQIAIGNQEGMFQINHENQRLENNFPGFFNGMHPAMNQKLINDQVERIKQIQQKVIENHFPGAGKYAVLDGNAQHRFIQGNPMGAQENIGMWKQDEYNGISEENRGRIEHPIQNNREIPNIDHNMKKNIPNVGTASFSHLRFGPLGEQQRHEPFMNNNAHSFNLIQNQFIDSHKFPNEEISIGSQRQVEREHWRPQRYSEESNNQHVDVQNDTYESQKLKSEDSIKGSDERKGREIKHSFEHEGSVGQEHQEISLDDHAKEHFYGNGGQEEAKPSLSGKDYSQFHSYTHQEPQVKVITKAIPVHKELKIPVPQMVRHPILIPVPYKVLEPYPIKIPVPVTVEKTIEVPVEKVVHYPVEKPVPMKVVKEVRVPVPKPYPVKVPVYKIKYVHHNKKKHE